MKFNYKIVNSILQLGKSVGAGLATIGLVGAGVGVGVVFVIFINTLISLLTNKGFILEFIEKNSELTFLVISLIILLIYVLLIQQIKKAEYRIEQEEKIIYVIYLLYVLLVMVCLLLMYFFFNNLIIRLILNVISINVLFHLLVLKWFLLIGAISYGSVQKWVIINYREHFLGILITNFIGFNSAGYNITNSLGYSCLLLVVIAFVLEEKNEVQEIFFYQMHFCNILSYTFVRLGKIDWGWLTVTITIMTWILPMLYSIIALSKNERKLLGDFDVNERTIKTKIISQIAFLQLSIRYYLNKLQVDSLSAITYLMYLYAIFSFLPIIAGPVLASGIYIAFISNEFASKVTLKRIKVNNNYSKMIANNLSFSQKRHMQKVTQAVVEFAAENPGKTMTMVGGVVVAGMALIGNVYQVEASNRSAEASIMEATNLKEYTQESRLGREEDRLGREEAIASRHNENVRAALDELKQGVVSNERKTTLIEQAKTGEIPKNSVETLLIELNKKSE